MSLWNGNMAGRLRRALDNAATAGAHADRTLGKADVILDEIGDLLDRLQDEGIDLTLDIGGIPMPVKIKIDLGDDNEAGISVGEIKDTDENS